MMRGIGGAARGLALGAIVVGMSIVGSGPASAAESKDAMRAEAVKRLAAKLVEKPGFTATVYITVAGAQAVVETAGMDAQNLTVVQNGNKVAIPWSAVSDADLVEVSRSCLLVAPGFPQVAEARLFLARLCEACGFFARSWEDAKIAVSTGLPADLDAQAKMLLDGVSKKFTPPAPIRDAMDYPKPVQVSTAKHPYLFFTEEDLPAIRQRSMEKGPAVKFMHFLMRMGTKTAYAPSSIEEIPMTACWGHVSGEKRYIEAAGKSLVKFCGSNKPFTGGFVMQQGGTLRNADIAYDLVYNALSAEERKTVEDFIVTGATYLYNGGKAGRTHWSGRNQRLGNWRPQMYSGVGLAGMVLWDTHPDAKAWVKDASDIMKDVLDHDYDSEGGAYEAYVRYVLGVEYHSYIPTLYALRRVTGEDLFGYNNVILQKSIPFAAYMFFPARDKIVPLGDSGDGLYSVGMCLMSAAAEYGDGLAAWYLDDLLAKDFSQFWGDNECILGTIWAKPAKPEDPDKSPRLLLAKAYNSRPNDNVMFGTGHVFLRTGFTDPEDIYFAAQAGEQGGFHGHADKGSYIMSAYGVEFLRDFFTGGYEGTPFFKFHHSSEAHQLVTIDGEGQGAEEVSPRFDPLYHIKAADVEAIESNKGYDYVRMNLAKSYSLNPKVGQMKRAYRHVVFVRQTAKTGWLVVMDDMEKDGAEHEFAHAFHYDPKGITPKVEGGNKITLSNPKASLYVVVAHPADPFKDSAQVTDEDAFVKLTCTKKMPRFDMVTVLYPVKGDLAAPAITPVTDGEKIGVEISGVKVTFDKGTGKVEVTGKLSDIKSVPEKG